MAAEPQPSSIPLLRVPEPRDPVSDQDVVRDIATTLYQHPKLLALIRQLLAESVGDADLYFPRAKKNKKPKATEDDSYENRPPDPRYIALRSHAIEVAGVHDRLFEKRSVVILGEPIYVESQYSECVGRHTLEVALCADKMAVDNPDVFNSKPKESVAIRVVKSFNALIARHNEATEGHRELAASDGQKEGCREAEDGNWYPNSEFWTAKKASKHYHVSDHKLRQLAYHHPLEMPSAKRDNNRQRVEVVISFVERRFDKRKQPLP